MLSRSRYALPALLLGLVLLTGCTTAKISGRGAKPLYLNNPDTRVEVIDRIDKKKLVLFDYTNTFDVSKVIAEELVRNDADAVANVAVEVGSDVGTALINFLTLGLANAQTVKVEGDLIRYHYDDETMARSRR